MSVGKHPPVAHYDRGSVQPIDFMEGNFTPDEYLGFLKGQVIKYISRFRYKGTPIADLEKAQTYLGWLREYYGRLSANFDDPKSLAGGMAINPERYNYCETPK
jgi:hypothetical protein